MPPKGRPKKKDPAAPTPIPEDSYLRVRKLCDLKVAPKQPKGELTSEEWCIPPTFHSAPEFRTIIHYWQQCATVRYSEREMKVPTRMKVVDAESTVQKPHPRKEIQDLFKYCKTQVKQATKRTAQFLKQLEKKENKEVKRENLLRQIDEVDTQMNEELRNARRFVERQQLFEKKYMVGSKLGESAPPKNVLIAMELSDRQQSWVDETKDEVLKLMNQVISEGETETLNVATFSTSGVNTWCPQFQNKGDAKKGLPDAQKWVGKNMTSKNCSSQQFPPDYAALLQKFAGEGATLPGRIFLCCSRMPDKSDVAQEALDLIKDARRANEAAMKGEPVLPVNVVAFDASICGDASEKAFFEELAGPSGSFMIDSSAEDLLALDKILKAIQVRKKQLDKLSKKLDKMEDLSERVAEDRKLLQMQIALQRMLESDFEILDWALKNEQQVTGPEI